MVDALKGQGLLHVVEDQAQGPNGNVFAIPKSLEKASLIVNLVLFNRAMMRRPPSFHLPSVEVPALLMKVLLCGSLDFLPSQVIFEQNCKQPFCMLLGKFSVVSLTAQQHDLTNTKIPACMY